jgi:hypothetical protein
MAGAESSTFPARPGSGFGYSADLPGFPGYANVTSHGARAGINYGSQIKCFAGNANLTSNGAPRIK